MKETQLTDQCPMPFGRHMGKDMEDVPAAHLLYIHNKHVKEFKAGEIPKAKPLFLVMEYIQDNLQGLNKELNQKLKR